MKVKVWSDTGT